MNKQVYSSLKNVSLLCISSSKIWSILDSSAIGLYLEHSRFESFLLMGIKIFEGVGCIPEEKERLKISARCVEISFFSNFNILADILFGPQDLLSLREDIMEITSSLPIDVIKKEFKLLP